MRNCRHYRISDWRARIDPPVGDPGANERPGGQLVNDQPKTGNQRFFAGFIRLTRLDAPSIRSYIWSTSGLVVRRFGSLSR